jgi:SAM-dependent methyltransferase
MNSNNWQESLPAPPKKILVVGDPTGEVTFWLAEHGYLPTLVEPSAEALKIIRRAMVALQFSVQNRIQDIRQTQPSGDTSFDFILKDSILTALPQTEP